MSDEEDLPQDVKDLQKDIIIDLLGKAKRRFKRSVGDNLKLAFHYEWRKRLDPENPEDFPYLLDFLKEKLEKIRPLGYVLGKKFREGIENLSPYKNWTEIFGLDQYGNPLPGMTIGDVRQLHENFQEDKVSRALEDAKHFAGRVEKSPIGTGTKKFSSAIGPVITKYTEKLAGYNEDRLEQFGYKDGRKFAEVTPPKPTSKAGEFLKKVSGELNKDLKKAAGELDIDFRAAFHYTKGKHLDSKNPEDKKVLEARMPMEYWIEKNATYGEQKWFNEKFGIMENGKRMPGKTRADVKALYDNFDKTKKSAAYEALKNLKIGKYGWSDLGRSLYHGVEKIGDGILYFPRRYLENERRENREWEETYCGFTPRMNAYMKTKRLEREALKEAIKKRAQAQVGMATQFIPVGAAGTSSPVVYMFNYQPQILAVDPSLFNRNQGQTN